MLRKQIKFIEYLKTQETHSILNTCTIVECTTGQIILYVHYSLLQLSQSTHETQWISYTKCYLHWILIMPYFTAFSKKD